MAKLVAYKPHVEVSATITLNLVELRALDALTGYGVDKLLAHFYKHMGEAYLKPYEHGLRSFLEAAASVSLHPANEAQKLLDTAHRAKCEGRHMVMSPPQVIEEEPS